MKDEALNNYVTDLQKAWGPINDNAISNIEIILHKISHDSFILEWLASELETKNSKELYRDEKFGFVLTAYSETFGQYRIPHDHGDGWVIYAVMSGTMEMGSYSQENEGSQQELKLNSLVRLNGGESRLYLRGEIHDTRCLSDEVIILRFTSCDLKIEEEEGRMKRFGQQILVLSAL